MDVSIITTTINVPTVIKNYCQNAKTYGYDDVNFIIVGDKQTPLEVTDFCNGLVKQYGLSILYYDVKRQLDYLQRFPDLADYLPFNSPERRNVGLLIAYEMGTDFVITIDDDNFPIASQ